MAAYAVSPFNAIERAWKPFNPILGETFELEVGKGVRYLAEQVRRGELGVTCAAKRLPDGSARSARSHQVSV